MEINSIDRCIKVWHWLVYLFTWVFMWGYFTFIAPTTFKMLRDIGQDIWFISRIPQYTLFFGMILSMVLIYGHSRNLTKLQNGTGGTQLKSILFLSIAYLIPLVTFIGEVSLMVQTAIAIPMKH